MATNAVATCRRPRCPQYVVVMLALAVSVAAACSVKDPGPTPLFNGSVSRVDPETAKKQFGGAGGWRVLDEWRRDPREGRVPAHVLRLWLEPYTDVGQPGALMLSFFNEQLDSVTFFPKDISKYLSDLQVQRGLTLSNGAELRVAPGTRVFTGVNATGQAYVTWEDGALVDRRRKAVD